MLGLGKQFPFDPNRIFLWPIAGLEVLALLGWLLRRESKQTDELRVSKFRTDRLLFGLAVTVQFLCALATGTKIAETWTVGFSLVAVITLVLTKTVEDVLETFKQVGFGIIILSWSFELTPLSDKAFPTGYSVNPLGYRFMGIMAHPNLMGMVTILTFAILLTSKKIPWFKLAICLFTLLATEYRGGILSSIFIVLAWGFYNSFPFKKLVLGAGGVVATLTAIYISSPRESQGDALTGRGQIWSICLRLINSNPLYGSGPRTIERLYGIDSVDWFRPFHCHNQLIDDVTNFGFLGGLFMTLGLVTFALVKLRNRHLRLGFILLAVSICSLFESPMRLFVAAGYLFLPILILACSFGRSKSSI
jgi:hypothetical protein